MAEIMPAESIEKRDVVRKLNDGLAKNLISRLPSEQAQRLELALKSARGFDITLPKDHATTLSSRFTPATIETASELVVGLLPNVPREAILVDKVIDSSLFRRSFEQQVRQLQIVNPDQEAALQYWVQNLGELPKNRPIHDRFLEKLGKRFREVSIGAKLIVAWVGVGIQDRFPQLRQNLSNFPITTQIAQDVVRVSANQDEETSDRRVKEVAERYKFGEVSFSIVNHPDFRSRLKKSLALATTIYTLPRQILGWGAYWGLLTHPAFRETVDQQGLIVAGLSAGILAAGALFRMGIDYHVLSRVGWSPDTWESVPAMLTGKIDRNYRLRANPKWGLLGAPVDIAVSSLQPPYSVAWFINPPYSVPAYIWAMTVDQAVFSITNLGFLATHQLKSYKVKTGRT